jgi:toxin-antitoxin system PIN domain toxin
LSEFLLDVNVLVALFWPLHRLHPIAMRWFARNARRGWATCPFTQAGLVRLVSNAAVSGLVVSPQDAVGLLAENLTHPHHRFWPDDISFQEAIAPFTDRLVGYRQVTDAYLLGLAIHHGGRLATLDRGALSLLPEASPHREHVEFISQ